MPRQRHNDSGDPKLDLCSRPKCSHPRYAHNPEGGNCTKRHYDPFHNIGDTCRCKGFLEPRKKPVKAASNIVHLHASWHGEPPVAGDFLMSPHKPRYAYRIMEIVPRGQGRAASIHDWYDITAERMFVKDVPKQDVKIHAWTWNERKSTDSKRPARSWT